MVTWDDVDRLASILPEASKQVSPQGLATWKVKGKGFAWERPLRRANDEALRDNAPEGGILASWSPIWSPKRR